MSGLFYINSVERKSEISKLKNLGSVTEEWLNSIDVYTRGELEQLGPIVTYHMLKAKGYMVTNMLLYALQGALMDLHWKDVPENIKEQLVKEITDNPIDII